MKWHQGRDVLVQMVARGELQRIAPSRAQADRLVAQAHGHLAAAQAIAVIDAVGAYQLLYEAARKRDCLRRSWIAGAHS